MKAAEISFRDVYHRVCFVKAGKNYMMSLYLIHGNNAPEGCWVRCEKIADGMMAGTLLNEPDSDFGVHRGDLISFGIAQQGDRLLCVAVL